VIKHLVTSDGWGYALAAAVGVLTLWRRLAAQRRAPLRVGLAS